MNLCRIEGSCVRFLLTDWHGGLHSLQSLAPAADGVAITIKDSGGVGVLAGRMALIHDRISVLHANEWVWLR